MPRLFTFCILSCCPASVCLVQLSNDLYTGFFFVKSYNMHSCVHVYFFIFQSMKENKVYFLVFFPLRTFYLQSLSCSFKVLSEKGKSASLNRKHVKCNRDVEPIAAKNSCVCALLVPNMQVHRTVHLTTRSATWPPTTMTRISVADEHFPWHPDPHHFFAFTPHWFCQRLSRVSKKINK